MMDGLAHVEESGYQRKWSLLLLHPVARANGMVRYLWGHVAKHYPHTMLFGVRNKIIYPILQSTPFYALEVIEMFHIGNGNPLSSSNALHTVNGFIDVVLAAHFVNKAGRIYRHTDAVADFIRKNGLEERLVQGSLKNFYDRHIVKAASMYHGLSSEYHNMADKSYAEIPSGDRLVNNVVTFFKGPDKRFLEEYL